MSRGRLRGDRRGLTLIELLLTLTILAFAGVLVSGALVTGLRAWQSGLHSGREELVARIVLERIAAQLRCAIDARATRDGSAAVAFDASEEHLRFVTLAAGGSTPVQVAYELAQQGNARQLVYREYPWPDKEFFAPGRRPRREESVVEIGGFTVRAVKRRRTRDQDKGEGGAAGTVQPDTTDPRGGAEWSPLDQELPESVSVEILVGPSGGAEPRRYEISVPVPTRRLP